MMLSATGKRHQSFAPERAIWNTDLGKALPAQHVKGNFRAANHIALISAGVIIGLLGKASAGKDVRPDSKSAKTPSIKGLEVLASLAGSRIKEFLRLTISTLKRKLGHLTCSTQHNAESFCGKRKLTAAICKFFAPTVTESKRTNSHGLDPGYFDIACKRIEEAYKQPRLFDEPPPKPVQERML
jgi:hypothetical protein